MIQQKCIWKIFLRFKLLSGNPAVSVPVGMDSNNLPIGMHIMSSHFNEYNLLCFSKKLINQ